MIESADDTPPEPESDEPVDESGSPIVTPYLIAARIIAVLGMSFAIAVGMFLLLAGGFIAGLVILLIAVPFYLLMRYVERRTPIAEPGDGEEIEPANPLF